MITEIKTLFEIRVDQIKRCYNVSVTKNSNILFEVKRRRFDIALDECLGWILRQGGANKV